MMDDDNNNQECSVKPHEHVMLKQFEHVIGAVRKHRHPRVRCVGGAIIIPGPNAVWDDPTPAERAFAPFD